MAYIGRQLARGENKLFDDISSSFNGSTTTFTLAVSSVATATATPYQLFVSLGGVMQKPNTDFTTAGNQITFTTAPAAGLSCWIMMQGDTIDQAAIPDASVTPSKISGTNFAFSGDLRLKDADGSHYVGFASPTTVSTNKVWTLPAADGSASQYLQTNGSGVLSWATVSIGGGTGIDFNDNVKARWGTGNDLEVFHNGSNSVINDAGTGDLLLQVGGSTKATVSSTGLAVTGALTVSTNATISGNLTVSGTTTTVDSVTLSVKDKNIEMGVVSSPSDTTADGGGITLKGASDKTFNWVDSTDAWTSSEHIHIPDSKHLILGTGSDLKVYHDGSNSWVREMGTGSLIIDTNGTDIQLTQGGAGENMAKFIKDGAVELYHNNAKKIETTSGGINVTGAINVNGAALSTAPQVSLVADGAIAANHSVVVTSAGKAKEIAEVITTNNPPTALTPADLGSDTIENNGGVRVGYDPVRDFIFVLWVDGASDLNMSSYAWSNAGSTLPSEEDTTEINNNYVESWPQIASHPTNGYHMVAFKTGANNKGRARLFNFADNGQPSTGADQQVSDGTVSSPYENTQQAVYDPDTDKFIVGWRDGANNAQICVLTPNYSNKTLSRGSEVQAFNDYAETMQMFYDEYSNKIIAAIWNGTTKYLEAKIGTVSGTSTSWSSAVNIAGDGTSSNNGSWMAVGGDPTTGKLLFAWMHNDGGSNLYGKCKVASVNGSSFDLGSETTFQGTTAGGTNRIRVNYDPTIGKMILLYRISTTTTQVLTVTISGTTPSFTSPVTISGSSNTSHSTVYNPDLSRWCFVFRDSSGNRSNTTIDIGGATNNLSTSFIGFSDAAYSDGQTAKINVVGNTTTQSSLTAGSTYYVNKQGNLQTTADTPSVLAGVALSSTKLLIKPA